MNPRTYFAQALDAFLRSGRRAGLDRCDTHLAGALVRWHFAGAAMRPLLFPALSHLATPDTAARADLDVYAWDSASTGEPPLAPEWPLDAYAERGEVRAFAGGDVLATFNMQASLLQLLDRETKRAIVWAQDAGHVPSYERGAPARSILSWWLDERGMQLVHAAAVGTGDSGVLVLGKGGSGKSNTALLCLGAGLTYLADDYCVVEPGPEPKVHSAYSTAKVHVDDLARFPFLAGSTLQRPDGKALFFLADRHPSRLPATLPIRALLLPEVRLDRPTSIHAATPGDAARAMAMSTIAQMPHAGGNVLRRVSTVARQVPAYVLTVGADATDRLPGLILQAAGGRVEAIRG